MVFLDAVAGVHAQAAELVAICDTNKTRMTWQLARLADEYALQPVPRYDAGDFQRMLIARRPEVVIVCTPDFCHHNYVVTAMEAGCDVICEKPLTVDAEKARQILDALRITGRSLQITFNVRYIPAVAKVRELILGGAIGTPTAVDLAWSLDTSHGADYFRRWHREKAKSGGLLVHKASHHFDLVNWWLQDSPESVYAIGGLRFYGRENARARGDEHLTQYARYTGNPAANDDPFAMHLDASVPSTGGAAYSTTTLQGLYLNAEAEDGYVRDQNVFGDGITIEDTLALSCRYKSGAILNYSLIAYSPWEGFRAVVTGTRGRIELYAQSEPHIPKPKAALDRSEPNHVEPSSFRLTVSPMFGRSFEVTIESASGGHSGGDPLLISDLFQSELPPDPLGRRAGIRDAISSLLVGICGNQSLLSGMPVRCDDVLSL
jgi:predicted dehydrogenase